MKIVVDVNVVISAAITSGASRTVLLTATDDFLAPPELSEEVWPYTDLVREKSGLDDDEVEYQIEGLLDRITIVPLSIPPEHIKRARSELNALDPDDVPYLATALTVGGSIWSDDTHLQEQSLVSALSTEEMVSRVLG